MERIEKTINIDNSRSHRNGLLPFVRYGGSSIESVTAIEPNGNYGQYVCDFSIFKKNEDDTFSEVARLKYLDVIRRYSFIHNEMKNGVLVKKTETNDEVVTKIDCGDGVASSAKTTTKTETKSKLFENFIEIDEKVIYDYTPLDIRLFNKYDNVYDFEIPYEYLEIFEKEESELTEEEIKLKSKVDNHKELLNNNDFFILIDNYDDVIELNNLWEKWWKDNFILDSGKDWRDLVFDGYEESNYALQFYSDVNKYIIGEVEVPSKYDGQYVPQYVNYFSYFDLKNWFEINSAATVNAEIKPTSENSWVIDKWRERGGEEFYSFLTQFKPLWQTNKTLNYRIEGDEGLYFCYSAPMNVVNVLINNEMDYETLYDVYEYSAINNEFEGVVKPYEAPKEGIGSGLTKQWLNLEDDESSAMCESQLRTLIHPSSMMISNKIFGIYEVYNKERPEEGQMFKCTFCSGRSETPKVESFYSGYSYTYKDLTDENGEVTGETFSKTEIKKTPEGLIEEKPPLTSAYQILNVSVIGESYETKEEKEEVTSEEKLIEEKYHWSSITYTEYSWWECEKVVDKNDLNSLLCADGESIRSEETKYRNVTILSYIDNIVGYKNYGDVFYFLSRYDNGVIGYGERSIIDDNTVISIGLPYKEGEVVNVTTYNNGEVVYDKIKSIEYVDNNTTAIIKYAKGITSGATEEESGIHYEEALSCELNKKEIIPIDGVYMAEVYYNEIGFDGDKVEVYSEEYNLTRKTNLARITGMEICTQWTENGAVDAMLITKDGSEGLQEEPKYNLNLLYNRGNAAAYESHFKLSECNTMEDLENYGNNFFNL